jgi:hypothetical protein
MGSPGDAETVAGLVAAGRERDGTVISVPGRTTDYSYADFCTDVWKSGNLLRHYGLRAGAESAAVVGPKAADGDGAWGSGDHTAGKAIGWPDAADPLLAVLGAGVLGATVDLDPPPAPDCRTLVLPAACVDQYDPAPGCSLLAYGGPPETAEVAHFEGERWSENPMRPPDPAGPSAPLVEGLTQGTLLDAAGSVVGEMHLAAGDRVAVCAPLSTAGAVVAGLLAPMLAGATAVLAGPDCAYDQEVAVVVDADGDLDPATVIG